MTIVEVHCSFGNSFCFVSNSDSLSHLHSGEISQQIFQDLWIHWLRNNFINLMRPCLLDEFLLNVTSASHNHRLVHICLPVERANLLAQLISVHDRHANICQNQSVHVSASLEAQLHFCESFQTVVRSVHYLRQTSNFKLLQELLHPEDIVWLIVNNKDSFNRGNH